MELYNLFTFTSGGVRGRYAVMTCVNIPVLPDVACTILYSKVKSTTPFAVRFAADGRVLAT